MRFATGAFLVAVITLAACRMTPAAITSPKPLTFNPSSAAACPDGRPEQPGLTEFGAYIGTWQASHQRVPQTSDYQIATITGRVSVQCSAGDFVVVEGLSFTFDVPSGRAVQFALSELPADSAKLSDRNVSGCRALRYQSRQLAKQLPKDDAGGLADVVLIPTSGYGSTSVSIVVIQVANGKGDPVTACTLS